MNKDPSTIRSDIHQCLLKIERDVSAGKHDNAICIRINDELRRVGKVGQAPAVMVASLPYAKFLKGIMERWPKYSGFVPYPVPAPDSTRDAGAAFVRANMSGKLWDESTQYGRDRHELLQWLIKETAPIPAQSGNITCVVTTLVIMVASFIIAFDFTLLGRC